MVQATSEDNADTVRSPDAWQPIETAPKNRGSILVAWEHADNAWAITVAWWSDGEQTGWMDGSVGSWGYEEFAILKPTHWLALPAPPQRQGDRTV